MYVCAYIYIYICIHTHTERVDWGLRFSGQGFGDATAVEAHSVPTVGPSPDKDHLHRGKAILSACIVGPLDSLNLLETLTATCS